MKPFSPNSPGHARVDLSVAPEIRSSPPWEGTGGGDVGFHGGAPKIGTYNLSAAYTNGTSDPANHQFRING